MHDLTYRLMNRLFRMLFRVLGLRIDIVGADNIPTDGPAILATNHTGFLDFTFVALAASRRARLVRFMVKRSIYDHPIAGPLIRNMGHIRVDRAHGADASCDAEHALDSGEVVGIYPEATISRAWTLKPFKLGAAALAIKKHVPLIPVIVWGAHRIATVDGHRTWRRGIPVTIRIGEPILTTAECDVEEVSTALRVRMQQLLDDAQRTYPETPKNRTDAWWLPAHLGGSAPNPTAGSELDRRAVAMVDGDGLPYEPSDTTVLNSATAKGPDRRVAA
jgi:1-acyl-sn-glycerol-3-phosphate acyltransferase